MPNRQRTGAEQYRYGYQGEFTETDPETGKPAFELRLYDPRINRWLTTDPYGEFYSPYLSMGNNWVNTIDPDGGMTNDCCGEWYSNVENQLDEVVVTAPRKGGNFSDRLPDLGIVGANWLKHATFNPWESSFKGSLQDYNKAYGTNYTNHHRAYGDWLYSHVYYPAQSEHIQSIYATTNKAAELVGYVLPTPLAGVNIAKGLPALTRGLNLGYKYTDEALQVIQLGGNRIKANYET